MIINDKMVDKETKELLLSLVGLSIGIGVLFICSNQLRYLEGRNEIIGVILVAFILLSTMKLLYNFIRYFIYYKKSRIEIKENKNGNI